MDKKKRPCLYWWEENVFSYLASSLEHLLLLRVLKKGWLCDGEELAPKNFLGNLKKVKELLLQKQVNFNLQHTERDKKTDVDN